MVFPIFPNFSTFLCPGGTPRGRPQGASQGAAPKPRGRFEMDLDGASEEQVTEAATLALASALVFQVEELSMVNLDG